MTHISDEEKATWLEGLKTFDDQNRNIILAAFAVFGVPTNYLDVGCGSGVMVRTARGLGVNAYGIDLIRHPEVYFFEHDLVEPFIGQQPLCELVTSLETAEHVDEVGVENYCDTLTKNVAEGGYLLFTGAPPGQPGHRHVNCQPAMYWREKLYKRGLDYSGAWTSRLALVWTQTKMSQHHLEANLQVFVK